MNEANRNEVKVPSEPNRDDTCSTRASIFQRLAAPQSTDRQQAWSEFLARYSPVISSFAARCGASRQDIDDIVQDVMVSFFAKSGDFVYDPRKGRFRGYLKTCTVRVAIRRAGKNMRFRGIPLSEISDAEVAVEPIWNDVWEQQLVAQALRIVREEQADSIAIRAFEQYVLLDRDADVVAAELQTSVNNVHQAKTRIAKRLRDIVQQLRREVEE
jgi:RNA polymerase sigma-70 factor, ECF subfamily